jgi:RNA polymerase sigma-70 factor (ECF subfamily)
MSRVPDETQLVALARSGQRLAFERLLVRHQRRLADHVRGRMPARFKSVIDVEDVLQEAFADGWDGFGDFQAQGQDALFHWLARIAENRLLDAVKAQRAAKRGGGWKRVEDHPDDELTRALSLLATHQRTPSRSVANREALQAVRAALPGLKEDYYNVLHMRFLEGRSVADTAVRLKRSEWAVHKLTARALASLREALGDAGRFLSEH